MSDLISRQAAIDKADSLYRDTKNDECYMITGYNHAISDIRAILKSLPSAQPEIIRCKDCKHRHLDGMIWDCPFGLSGGEDFFCSYGAKDGDSDDE